MVQIDAPGKPWRSRRVPVSIFGLKPKRTGPTIFSQTAFRYPDSVLCGSNWQGSPKAPCRGPLRPFQAQGRWQVWNSVEILAQVRNRPGSNRYQKMWVALTASSVKAASEQSLVIPVFRLAPYSMREPLRVEEGGEVLEGQVFFSLVHRASLFLGCRTGVLRQIRHTPQNRRGPVGQMVPP